MEIGAAEIAEAVDDELQDGALAHRDQGLGQDLGIGVQAGAQTAGHNDHRQPGAGAVVQVHAAGEDDVHNAALFVQQGQRVDALLLNVGPGAGALLQGQAFGVVVGGLAQRALQRAASQDVLADVAVGHRSRQLALRGNEQDALAGLVQLFQGIQHTGVFVDQQLVDAQHGRSPLFRGCIVTAPAARR